MSQILIVDDDEQNLYLLQVLLQGNGYGVRTARNGIEALDVARREAPDLIITDILMPGMDGFRLCREWVADEKLQHIPLVFYTATYTDPKDEAFALSLGAARFIVKPTEPDAFVDILRQVLANHEAQRLVPVSGPSQPEEEHYRQYSEVLIRKLEDKMVQLEEANRLLELDIAARKQAEEALRQSLEREHFLAELVENADQPIGVGYPDGRLGICNRAFCDLTGYNAEELRSVAWDKVLTPPEWLEAEWQALAELERTGTPVRYQKEYLRKDGRRVPVELLVHAVRDEAGQVQYYYAFVTDISERKQAEEALRRRNRELTLLNRIIAATAAATDQGVALILETVCRELALAFDVPQAAAALFDEARSQSVVVAEYPSVGSGPGQVLDRPSALGERIPVAGNLAFQHLLTEKTPLVIAEAQTDPRLAPVRDLMRRRGTVSLLLLPVIVDGEVVASLAVEALEPRAFSAEEVDLGRRVAEQVSGVLARARLEEQRQQLEEQFRQAQKLEAVGRLAGGIAHDFNNMLTVIQLSSRLLERQLHPRDPLWEHVQRIRDAGQRAADLTRQLLAFSRREIVEPRLLDLNEAVSNLDKMLRRLIGEDVRLETVLAEDLWPVKIDPSQIDQVILNLVVNARDAMPMGGNLIIETANRVLDRAYTALHLDVEPGEYVLLAVSDTGVGMDDEVKAHLFEPFFTTKEKGKGTGLGLATVHGIVKQNRGHIWVYSEPGQGTTFRIYLPRARGEAKAETETQVEVPTLPPPPISAATILLVEDEDQLRGLTRDILVAQGYRVLSAKDGVEALQVAQNHEGPIHLLLTDVVMPRLSGKELADKLQAVHPEMHVLYTSGYTDNAIVRHGVLDEGIHFLSKPFGLETLAGKVRQVLGGKA